MTQELDLSEMILRAFLVRHSRLTRRGSGVTLVGSRFDSNTRRLLEVLARNRLSSRWLELERSPEAEALLMELDVPVDDLPIVAVPGGPVLRNPSSRELLGALGLVPGNARVSSDRCELLVIGGGPAGLAAAMYGASEGMATAPPSSPRTPHSGARPAHRPGSRTTWAFRLGSRARSWRHERSCRRRSSVSASTWPRERLRSPRTPAPIRFGSRMARWSPPRR